jgi:hypothetical protein
MLCFGIYKRCEVVNSHINCYLYKIIINKHKEIYKYKIKYIPPHIYIFIYIYIYIYIMQPSATSPTTGQRHINDAAGGYIATRDAWFKAIQVQATELNCFIAAKNGYITATQTYTNNM